jgi:hypothetical protein
VDFSLFVCFESHEQLFSYLETVTITGDGAANLDLCLGLTASSSDGLFFFFFLHRFEVKYCYFLLLYFLQCRKDLVILTSPVRIPLWDMG